MPNVPLMRKVLEQIRHEPDEWNQEDWVTTCGTARCFAGWALELTGHTLEKVRADKSNLSNCCDVAYVLDGKNIGCYTDEIRRVAEQELGITPYQSAPLFFGQNTLTHLEVLCEQLAGEKL